jgi:hypothetical protein
MEITWSMKEKKGENWDNLRLSAIAGKTLEQFFTESEGREIVAEFIIEDKPCYFCGTAYWMNRMGKKGRAVTFAQAIEILRAKKPGLLSEVISLLPEVSAAFPGAVIESHTQTGDLPEVQKPSVQARLF